VAQAAQVEALVRSTVTRYGRLDCAFNNAGTMGDANMSFSADCTEDNWDRVMATNLRGVWLCMKYEIAQMLTQGGGVIVNNASTAALVGTPGFVAYAASKHGLLGLTKTVAAEYARAGVRVNAVCPGAIRTPMLEAGIGDKPHIESAVVAMHPLGRLGRPAEVAEAAAWLCSDQASFVTGHALSVDGGFVTV
jgi:NAD(P)-dependent dehydrogenase (short-subunit alcohol dehydrogenase family)